MQKSFSFDKGNGFIKFVCRGLESQLSVVRARVFDVIYNLTVHAELLYPSQTTTIDIEAKVLSSHPGYKVLTTPEFWQFLTLLVVQATGHFQGIKDHKGSLLFS